MVVAGIISDTHGLLRPEALSALAGVGVILHAGDVGRAEVLEGLEKIAPVHAISGNVDAAGWLPETLTVNLETRRIHLVHQIAELDRSRSDYDVVIFGHSHKPVIEHRDGVLYVNPGSAGPRRFRLPVTVAKLTIAGGSVSAAIVPLL